LYIAAVTINAANWEQILDRWDKLLLVSGLVFDYSIKGRSSIEFHVVTVVVFSRDFLALIGS